ncbi:MAG: hypothetical protein H6843_08265 [Rhodospirillaceae bacterium]|nr:hypothetical protein [Rhodospirillaceae bacterium]
MTQNFSVLTNPQAASALLNLNRTNTQLGKAEERINTGLRIGSAKDDSATFAIALGMRSDVAGFKAIRENLSLGASTLGVASAGTNQIAEQIKEIREKVVQASNNAQGRVLIQQSIDNAIEQIQNFVAASRFNGINLVDGDPENAGTTYDVVSNIVRDGSNVAELQKISVDYQDLSIEESDRGLGALKGLNVTAGKSTEIVNDRNDPVATSVEFSGGLSDGEEITFNYIDGDGDQQALTFNTYEADAAGTSVETPGSSATNSANSVTTLSAGTLTALGGAPTADEVANALTRITFTYTRGTVVQTFDYDVTASSTTTAAALKAEIEATDFFQANDLEIDITGTDITIQEAANTTSAGASSFSAPVIEYSTTARTTLQDDFAIVGATAAAAAASFDNKLTELGKDGGPLAGLGFSFDSETTSGTLSVLRDLAEGIGQLGIFTTSSDPNKAFGSGDFKLTEAREGGLAQVELQINDDLEEGDTVDITFGKANGVSKTFTFVIAGPNDSVVSGAKIDGTDNKYYLDYGEVVGTALINKTPEEVAAYISTILNTAAGGIGTQGEMVSDIETFLGATLSDEFKIQAEDDAVVVTDRDQAFDNGLQILAFNMDSANGGSLDFDALLERVDEAENQLKLVAGIIGAAEQALEAQQEFVDTLIKSVNDGIGTLVDANMAEESARFQALQVQQQLGLQALSIANSNPQAILSLFQ